MQAWVLTGVCGKLPSPPPQPASLFLEVISDYVLERVGFPGLGKSSITETHSTQGTLESKSPSDTNLAPLPTKEEARSPAAACD